MKCVVVVLACALCLCSGYDLNTDADGSLGLPPSGDDVQPMDSDLKADKSFMAAQESLKQAQALPDVQTDDLGLGEGKAIPAHKDQVALAKGLSIALASKQQAQDQVKKMSQEMVQSKSKRASQMLATATSLAQCKKGFSEARSATKKTIAKLSAVANHQKTVAGVSMRGEN